MLLRQALIHKTPFQIHIVEEEVLVEVFAIANTCARGLCNLCLNLGVELLALALEHRSADVLWAKEEERRSPSERLTRQAVRVETNALEHIEYKEVARHTEETVSRIEEVVRSTRLHRKYIIVEIEILLVEPLDAMQVHLDRVTVECREILRRDNILVEHDMHLVTIYPLGNLALVRNYKVYLADERHILGYTTKEISQCTPIAETLLQHRLIGVFLVVALPYRIESIYICYNYIHDASFFVQRRFFITTNIEIYFQRCKKAHNYPKLFSGLHYNL